MGIIDIETGKNIKASTEVTCQPGEKWGDFEARRWATEHPHEHALVTSWYSMPEGVAMKNTDKDDKDALHAAVAAHRVAFVKCNRDYVLAANLETATSLLEKTTPHTGRDHEGSGYYAIQHAAAAEAKAAEAIAAYIAAADAPEGSDVAKKLAHTAEYARRAVAGEVWQCKNNAKASHGHGIQAQTKPGYRALAAARVALALVSEMATEWEQLVRGDSYQSFMGHDLDAEGAWREAAVQIAEALDAPLEVERQEAQATRRYFEGVEKDAWWVELETKRRAERGQLVAA